MEFLNCYSLKIILDDLKIEWAHSTIVKMNLESISLIIWYNMTKQNM